MSTQDWIAAALGLAAVAYLAWRVLRRRFAATCCGQRECPAAKATLSRLPRPPRPPER